MSSVYRIIKGVDQPIEFKGLKGQYIWWLGGGVVALLFLFAMMYLAGVEMWICVSVVFGLGTGLFWLVSRISRSFGAFGMMKAMAKRQIPKHLRRIAFYSP